MDEAARPSGPAVDEPKRGPQQIREDIEQTREELGETVEALAAKTDVKAQARAKVDETKQRALDTVETVRERVVGTKPADLKEAARAKADTVRSRVEAEATELRQAARAKAAPVTDRIDSARSGGPGSAHAAPSAAGRRDAARLLRSHPELFGLIAAFAAGMLVRSLAGS